MKTKMEAAIDYAFKNKYIVEGRGHILRESFNAGIEFAEKWIPVTEDLPNGESDVLVKDKNGNVCIGFFLHTWDINTSYPFEPSEWRYIKVK